MISTDFIYKFFLTLFGFFGYLFFCFLFFLRYYTTFCLVSCITLSVFGHIALSERRGGQSPHSS